MKERFFEKILLIGQIKSFEVYINDFIKDIDDSKPNEKWQTISQRFKDNLIVLNDATRIINYLEQEKNNLLKLAKFTEQMKETIYKLENFDRLKKENEQLKKNIK
tara:strand:- start:149 stop:463 length:315 start_codon:yes stop_codon:yes gene_type:complete